MKKIFFSFYCLFFALTTANAAYAPFPASFPGSCVWATDVVSTVRECVNLPGPNFLSSLSFEAYLPPNWSPSSAKFPVIIWVHGGAFLPTEVDYNKWIDASGSNIDSDRPLKIQLAAQGYVVLAPNYNGVYRNLTGNSDIRAFLRSPPPPYTNFFGQVYFFDQTSLYGLANVTDFADSVFSQSISDTYRLDLTNINIAGSSAGGYIALYEATRGKNKYNCVITNSTPSDLEKYISYDAYDDDILAGIGVIRVSFCYNCADYANRLATLNPTNANNFRNFKGNKLYIQHGTGDNMIPVSQAVTLAQKIRTSFPAVSIKENYLVQTPVAFPNTTHAADVNPLTSAQDIGAFCKQSANPVPTPACGSLQVNPILGSVLKDSCVAGTYSDVPDSNNAYLWKCGTASCSKSFPAWDAVQAAATLQGWPTSALIDNNPLTIWSSPLGDRFNSQAYWVAAWFAYAPGAQNVYEVGMKARMQNGVALGFPKQYKIYITDWLNSRWKLMGTYTVQPDSSGNVKIPIPNAPQQSFGVAIAPLELGTDNFNNYYFQLADIYFR